MKISLYEVFELNRILHSLIEQQSSYDINVAFKIYRLIKWLNETEQFIFERVSKIFGETSFDMTNPHHQAFLSSMINFEPTALTVGDLLSNNDVVTIDVKDVEVLEKILGKTEN